ncbi:hypothetical protein, partial [Clostridium sp. HBUAS56017]|uniref:hypothetical protein n=1 Tax=Clostridium sp. HBUAS56017 TaxID=2571128 RepID=UPI00163DDC9D
RSSNYVNEYYALGRNNPVDVRKLATIRDQIKIARMLVDGRCLTRSELLKIIKETADDTESVLVVSQIKAAIEEAEKAKGSKLTKEEVQKVIDETLAKRYEAAGRIIAGEASVEDYKRLGETKVTEDNIICINTDIKDSKTITVTDG